MGKGSMRKGKRISGCMWGLVNLFNFRRIQSGNKLITSRKNASRSSFSGRYRGAKDDKTGGIAANRSMDGGVKGVRRRSRSCDMDSNVNSHEVKRSAKSVDFDYKENRVGETKFVLLSELKRILRRKPQRNDHIFAESSDLKMEEDKFERIYAEARKHIFEVLNNGEKTPKSEQSNDDTEDSMLPVEPSPVSVLDARALEENDTSPLVAIEASMAIGIAPLRIVFEKFEGNEPETDVEESVVEDESVIAPLIINFEEGEATNPSASSEIVPLKIDGLLIEEEEDHAVPDLVTFLLESADIDWEQLDLKSNCCDQAIDPEIMEKDCFGDMEYWEKKNLVDCVNEIIAEILRRYTMKPIGEKRSTMREIRERVNWHRSSVPPPCSLEQLGKKDLWKPGLWIDLQEDQCLVAAEIEDIIFNDLVDELTLTS